MKLAKLMTPVVLTTKKIKEGITAATNFLKIPANPALASIFVIKLVVKGTNLPESLIVLGFLALFGFRDYLANKNAPDVNKQVLEELAKVKDRVSSLTMQGVYKK